VYDYGNDKQLGIVNGDNPSMNLDFNDYILIKVKPENK
jgi:hypothetical protein